MIKRRTLCTIYQALNTKFKDQFGFGIKDVTYTKVARYLYTPKDSSSLAVTRILFGVCMLFDIPDERGGVSIDQRWGGNHCHFPLFPFIRAVPMPYMTLIYTGLWIGALGITLGYKFRISSILFTVCYWYLFLIEKSYWNNHSYLFGLLALLLSFTEANCFWSLDSYVNPSLSKSTAPYWNYFVLKYQLFILYFMAGVKKGSAEWLSGYAMKSLSDHWVFMPFRLFLSGPQIDFLIVHCFIFMFDLTIAIWMMWARTRHVAMVFCALFHLMNSRLFRIGMFPWVCLVTQPLFYPFHWPKLVINLLKELILKLLSMVMNFLQNIKVVTPTTKDVIKERIDEKKGNQIKDFVERNETKNNDYEQEKGINELSKTIDDLLETNKVNYRDTDLNVERSNEKPTPQDSEALNDDTDLGNKGSVEENEVNCKRNVTTGLILVYMLIQAFLPFSHFLTKGYNNWTNGLYGYSWDMMVHSWDSHSVVIKIVDNHLQKEFFLDPYVYTPNDRWTRHGDMIYQYSHCLKTKIAEEKPGLSNISIFFDIWYSLNGRFGQRMFDSKVDMLKVSWSPFKEVSYLMPLLDEALEWRGLMDEIRDEVHSWSNKSEVVFLADFQGYDLQKFIPQELTNVTLTVLQGPIVFETEVTPLQTGSSYLLTGGNRIEIDTGLFHTVLNIGGNHAYYMYTFNNNTDTEIKDRKPMLPILQELGTRLINMVEFGHLIFGNIYGKCFWKLQCV